MFIQPKGSERILCDYDKTIITMTSVVSRFRTYAVAVLVLVATAVANDVAMGGVVKSCRGWRDSSGDGLWGAHTGY
jgi:hypothetical protein